MTTTRNRRKGNRGTVGNTRKHLAKNVAKKRHHCQKCDRNFDSHNSLQSHFANSQAHRSNSHTKNNSQKQPKSRANNSRTVPCPYCSRKFKSKAAADQHFRSNLVHMVTRVLAEMQPRPQITQPAHTNLITQPVQTNQITQPMQTNHTEEANPVERLSRRSCM
ncbi:hypothetical protein M408DRAFT_328949 [Serendipita vermifera MAFF 305830]|uniref:C2H2-type domain-containing protein n=1 Tax=Serendipita vermifera MAFF 305830 TaxID=933852 RepID=A0A0C2WT31_SERVB|nr:hypothetical protein M408DRAFT_328949 [Serendipita vermifera MAFF 305830]